MNSDINSFNVIVLNDVRIGLLSWEYIATITFYGIICNLLAYFSHCHLFIRYEISLIIIWQVLVVSDSDSFNVHVSVYLLMVKSNRNLY